MAKAKIKKITIDDLKTTIDNLAVSTSNGFKAADKKTDNLAAVVAKGFKKQEKLIDEKIDDLAAMTKRGFDKTASKEDLEVVRQDLEVVKTDIHFLKSDVQDIKEKVDNIEKLTLQQHGFQIKKLENKVKYIEEVLTID